VFYVEGCGEYDDGGDGHGVCQISDPSWEFSKWHGGLPLERLSEGVVERIGDVLHVTGLPVQTIAFVEITLEASQLNI
jgi:hypothetical protein